MDTVNLIDKVPQLKRGIVWCTTCGTSMEINSGDALHYGWPTCCGYTMTIDSPEERAVVLKGSRGNGKLHA